jgi:hypothetical protein
MSKTPKTPRTTLRKVAGLTITLLSLATTIRGEDATLETKSPVTGRVSSFDASALLRPNLTDSRPALPLSPVRLAPARENREPHRWKLSLIPFAGSQALDVSSSWGRRELNPVLAGDNGRFGAQAATVKLGVAGAFAGVEYLIVRKFPRTAGTFAKINWAGAALTTSFAVHNYATR